MNESDEYALMRMLGRSVLKVYIYVWPPYMEETLLAVSMSIGVEFEDDQGVVYKISTSRDDGWTPVVEKLLQQDAIDGKFFHLRVSRWMNGQLSDICDLEIFDMTEDPGFRSICGAAVRSIDLLTLADKLDPFGVRLRFDENILQITPTSDGSTVETLTFNNLGNIRVFEYLGALEEVDLFALRG